MNKKKMLIIALIAVLSIGTIVIWATGTQDYRAVKFFDDNAKPVLKPTAQFSLTHNGTTDESPAGIDLGSYSKTVYATVGDTVSIKDLSHSNRGKTLKAWDFQYSRPDDNNQLINTKAFEKSYMLDKTGTYTFSLCVRDTVENEAWTNYWGNWSDNGNHQVIGHNPGTNLSDPSDDFDGYWYFTRIVVIVGEKSYTLQEKHIDTNSGTVLNEIQHTDITDESFTTTSNIFDGYNFIGSRAGYTWNDIANGTTENISSRTANFDSTHTNAFHYYYYKKSDPPPPPSTGKANIVVYYKDKVSGAAVYPEDTTLTDVDYGTYTINALPAPEGYTFDTITPSPQTVTVDAANNSKTITFLYLPTDLPPGNNPPVAEATGPLQKMAGENVTYRGTGTDSDGVIVNKSWEYPGANHVQTSSTGDRLMVWYPYVGNYARDERARLTVTDDTGNTDSDSHTVEILPPIPSASLNITGKFKENRRVTLDASGSYSPSRYPINSYIWNITNAANIKSITPLNGNAINNVLYGIAGTYDNTITASNTVGLSDSETRPVTIVADQNPNANFAVTTKLLREPTDSNQALITISNLTTSPDGDQIKKVVVFYAYDSDNDGNFDEEVWNYSTNGTTWQNVGLPYSQIKTNFDIYNIAGGNPLNFTIKTNQVGKYKFEAMAIEDIPAADTIPELLSPSDYRRGDTFTSKPNSEKIVDVINTAPTVTFEVKKKKEVDILIATDYTGQKLANLQAALNIQKANLLAKNIDVKYTIVNTTAAVAHINDARYSFRRYGRYSFIADKYTYNNAGGDWYSDDPYQDTVLWEEMTALESEAPYLPLRNPTNLRWSKGPLLFREEPDDPTPSWEENYYLVNIQVANDGYRNSGVIDFTKKRDAGLDSLSGYTSGYEYTDIQNESVTVDKGFTKEEKIADVTVNVNSINFASVTSTTLRADSDRYLLFIGDSNSKIYSGAWGTHFPFGGLTKSEQDYIMTNNIKPYIVTPQATLDTIIGAERAKEVYSGSLTYFKSFDGTLMYISDYPVTVNLGGEIKEVYGNYILLTNGTLKVKSAGANFVTLATGVTKVIQEKNGNGDVLNLGNIWAVTSDGKLRQYKGGVAGYVFNYPDAVDVFYCIHLPYGDGCYLISCTSGTYFMNKGGTAKFLYGSPLAGYSETDATEWDDSDDREPVSIFVFKNGCVKIGIIYRDKDYNYSTSTYTYWINDIKMATFYQGIWNSDTNRYSYYGFPWVKPVKGRTVVVNNSILNLEGLQYDYDNGEYYFIDMTNPSYLAKNAFNAIQGTGDAVMYQFNDGSVSVPCKYTEKYTYEYHEDTKTRVNYLVKYVDIPALRNKTIKKFDAYNGFTYIHTTDGGLYRWVDTVAFYGKGGYPASYDFTFTPDVSDTYTMTYNISYYGGSNVLHPYYVVDENLKDMKTDNVILSDIRDTCFNEIENRFFAVVEDGKLYGEGNFGKTGVSSYIEIGESLHELIKTRMVINDTTKQYITLRDILNNVTDTKYFASGQYQAAVTDITNIYLNDTSYSTNYILVDDIVSYNTTYSDYEKDLKYAENWTYNHNQYYFDNSMGLASFHGQTLTAPVTIFDRNGRYTINAKARDNPKNDNRFDNYRLWSTGNQNLLLYVHRKPAALQKITIANNGNGTFTVRAYDAGSYDPDHSVTRADKGIVAREWRWRDSSSTVWTIGQMNKADCTADKSYISQLRVKDLEGVWSDYNTITLDKDNPPVALYTIDKPLISTAELLKVKDQSFPQSFSSITRWHWVVKKYNSDGTLPTTNLQNSQYNNSNNGTDSMAGYDVNVKTNYSTSGVGKYKIYLRVKDSNGLWSDGGTDAASDLNNFYSQDIVVDSPPTASFTIEKNPIYIEETLKLKDQSTAAGISPLAKWHWIVKKLNQDGTEPSTNLQDSQFTDSNTGTGAMTGYDVNVKTLYADKGAGTYRIYLRVMNGNGMWSDEGTAATYNIENFFKQDLVVQESFKMSNFRVVKIRDFHLEPYYNANDDYPDRPFYVNSMAIDPSNFMVGGISAVPGFSSLTKGYRFEFEIDSTNFNEANDTIVITPTFFSYTTGVPGVRGSETDLYWEDSNKSIYKAGEGGHSRWAAITLDSSNRTTTGDNSATWRGEYFIPSTSWLVPLGTTAANAKSSRLNADIIVNFSIRGYKDGVLKYDYNIQQWPIERTSEKLPYEIGDVIRYDYTKSSLNDTNTIINRP